MKIGDLYSGERTLNNAFFEFRNLCSMVSDQPLRECLECWLIKNVNTFQVEARIDRRAPSSVLEFEQKRTLAALINGIVGKAQTFEKREWLQGEHKFGTIITRRVDILYSIGESK